MYFDMIRINCLNVQTLSLLQLPQCHDGACWSRVHMRSEPDPP